MPSRRAWSSKWSFWGRKLKNKPSKDHTCTEDSNTESSNDCTEWEYKSPPLSWLYFVISDWFSSSSEDRPSLCPEMFLPSLARRRRALKYTAFQLYTARYDNSKYYLIMTNYFFHIQVNKFLKSMMLLYPMLVIMDNRKIKLTTRLTNQVIFSNKNTF